jgi:probable F420-dependent oxidoreductase
VKVRIGFGLATQGLAGGATQFATFVDDLERLGFDSLWLSERVASPAPDPLIGLAVAAGRTERLKFGTSVLVVPGRNPVLLAKEIATLDVLSNGRMLPAFGLGSVNPAEQQAFAVGRKERAGWFDEAVPLIRRLWSGETVTHEGERFTLTDMRIGPKPVQDPPDIWFGGAAPSELRRAGRLSDGWLPSFTTPEDASGGRVIVEEAAAEAGRTIDPEHFGPLVIYSRGELDPRLVALAEMRRPGRDPKDLFPVGLDALCERIEAFSAVGFSKFVLVCGSSPPDWTAELEEVAAAVLPLQDRLST